MDSDLFVTFGFVEFTEILVRLTIANLELFYTFIEVLLVIWEVFAWIFLEEFCSCFFGKTNSGRWLIGRLDADVLDSKCSPFKTEAISLMLVAAILLACTLACYNLANWAFFWATSAFSLAILVFFAYSAFFAASIWFASSTFFASASALASYSFLFIAVDFSAYSNFLSLLFF